MMGFNFFSDEFDFWLTSPKHQSLLLDTPISEITLLLLSHPRSIITWMPCTQIFLKGLTARMDSWPTLVLGTSLGTIPLAPSGIPPAHSLSSTGLPLGLDPEALNVACYQLVGSSYFARCIKIPLSKVKMPRHYGMTPRVGQKKRVLCGDNNRCRDLGPRSAGEGGVAMMLMKEGFNFSPQSTLSIALQFNKCAAILMSIL